MKKFSIALVCALTAFVCAFCFTACGEEPDNNAVNLVALSGGDQVGVMNNVDYYVVAEPVAGARVKAVEGLDYAGDLQQLYGGENGYPQAVVVAKAGLVSGSSFVSRFIGALEDNSEWLENASIETIVGAVENHLTDGLKPALSAANLSKDVISNCGIEFVSAQDSKAEIFAFMDEINSVSESSFGTPSQSFFWDGVYDNAEFSGEVSVYAPDGAPALGIANLLAGEGGFGNDVEVNYEVVNSTLINSYVNGANPKADICVLPVNAAVKLLGNGDTYKLIGTLTHGNLYIVSASGETITSDNINSLKGKTVGIVNLAAVPGLTFKIILKKYGLNFVELV